MIRFCLLGSGSRGNALLVTSPTAKVLIDNGFSLRQLRRRVAQAGESLDDLNAVFVTHEHSDHVGGLGVLARNVDAPVYITRETYAALPKSVGRIPRVAFFEAGDAITVDGLALTSFSTSHDAADPVSFVAHSNGAKLGIACDLGHVSQLVRMRLAGAHGLVLESNHCPDLLARGPYPASLQHRIRGKQGHLSNRDMNSLLASLLHDALRVVVLAHLSHENNSPELARKMAAHVLRGHPAELHIALQDAPTPVFEVTA